MADMNTASPGGGAFGSGTDRQAGRVRGSGNGDEGQSGFFGRVRESAAAQLSTQKDRAVDGIGSAARAVRQSSQQLRDQQHDTAAGYVEQAADQIERMSQRLRNKDVGELLNDAQRMARRQPALVVGSAFAIGLLGARFLKSSRDDDDASYEYREHGGQPRGGARFAEDWRTGAGTERAARLSRPPATPSAVAGVVPGATPASAAGISPATQTATSGLAGTDDRSTGGSMSQGPRTRRAGSDPERT